MKSKAGRIVVTAIIISCIIGIVVFYIYEVFVLHTEPTKNLLRALVTVGVLVSSLVKMFCGNGRKSLGAYEKLYEKEVGLAFRNKPGARKKLLKACRLYDESNYRKAIKYLSELLKEVESVRDRNPVLLFKAVCYKAWGLPEEAIKTYNELLNHDPTHAQAQSNLGLLYLEEGEFEKALAHYNQSIAWNPDNYYAYNNRGNYYFRVDDFENAIKDAKKALEIKNNGYEAASLLAIIYAMKHDKENQEKYYRIAVSSGQNPKTLSHAIDVYLAATAD